MCFVPVNPSTSTSDQFDNSPDQFHTSSKKKDNIQTNQPDIVTVIEHQVLQNGVQVDEYRIQRSPQVNPLHPSISMHILHSQLNTSP